MQTSNNSVRRIPRCYKRPKGFEREGDPDVYKQLPSEYWCKNLLPKIRFECYFTFWLKEEFLLIKLIRLLKESQT